MTMCQTVSFVIAILCLATVCESFVSRPSHLLLTRQHDEGHSQCVRTKSSSSAVTFLSAVHRRKTKGGSTFKGKKNNSGKNKSSNKAGGGDRRRQKTNTNASAGQPRPVLTIYEDERNEEVNEKRKNIVCEHFDSCPGCVVNTNVGKTDIVRSAARFFSSTSIRKNRLDVERSGEDWVVEAEEDGFYEVVVPTETSGDGRKCSTRTGQIYTSTII